jgi:micrococcal nuclease
VLRVVDGDTIKVLLNGNVQGVRLTGIDTPETVDPRKPVECFGKEASLQLKELLDGTFVRLEADSVGDSVDKYGRLLRYVYLDGRSINLAMIEDGYAYAYTAYPFSKAAEFEKAEQAAKSNQRGLWSPTTCSPDKAISSPSESPHAEQASRQSHWLVRFLRWLL